MTFLLLLAIFLFNDFKIILVKILHLYLNDKVGNKSFFLIFSEAPGKRKKTIDFVSCIHNMIVRNSNVNKYDAISKRIIDYSGGRGGGIKVVN